MRKFLASLLPGVNLAVFWVSIIHNSAMQLSDRRRKRPVGCKKSLTKTKPACPLLSSKAAQTAVG
jgi:hypothetical protein